MRRLFSRIACLYTLVLFLSFALAALSEVDEHIVLWLQFDEGKGDVAADSSVHGNDGTLHGPEWVEGKYGKALLFDGQDDYVEVASNDTIQLGEAGLTIAAWFRTDEKVREDLFIIEKGGWNSGEYGLGYPGSVWESPGNRQYVRLQINETTLNKEKGHAWIDSESGIAELSDNEWHHAAGVYDAVNAVARVYVDGVMEVEMQAGPRVFAPDDESAYLGTRATTGNWYKGVIDELLVADIPFTTEQVKKHMEGRLAPVYPAGSLATTWSAIKKAREGEHW